MTNKDLQKLLMQYPPDIEVFIEINNHYGIPHSINWEVGGVSSWITITDYPVPPEKKEKDG